MKRAMCYLFAFLAFASYCEARESLKIVDEAKLI